MRAFTSQTCVLTYTQTHMHRCKPFGDVEIFYNFSYRGFFLFFSLWHSVKSLLYSFASHRKSCKWNTWYEIILYNLFSSSSGITLSQNVTANVYTQLKVCMLSGQHLGTLHSILFKTVNCHSIMHPALLYLHRISEKNHKSHYPWPFSFLNVYQSWWIVEKERWMLNNFKLAWKSDIDFQKVANLLCHIHWLYIM